ncbi:uncharacterized protein LOC142608969 [Castanea sativa]|uniref:uncharacterized protein LOC142608969 n=1 Tax=Castanea sativa TaxID=21020 RepID=UPI003F65269B
MGLPEESRLRESLTRRPPEDMRQLMRRIEEYKRLEDDRLQSKGKASVAEQDGGDPSRRNQNLYCTYHKDKGHTTEQCRVLKDHLEQLVKAGYLKEFVAAPGNQEAEQADRLHGNTLPPPLGIIEVIHVALRDAQASRRNGVLAVVPAKNRTKEQPSGKRLKYTRWPIAFDDDNMKGTIQPHDNALVVTARMNSFIVKRVMIDQESGADVMYPDLYRGLDLKKEDLSKYDTPLMGFDGHMVILKGQTSLPISMEGKEVIVTFIVVASFSPYTAILGRPWIHAMGVVPSTLHVKVKFRTEKGITVIRGNQQVARQCFVAVASRGTGKKESTKETPL